MDGDSTDPHRPETSSPIQNATTHGGNDQAIADNNVFRYCLQVIATFRDGDTEKIYRRDRVKRFPPEVQRRAHRKLLLIQAAASVPDLRVPPGNRLEKLVGKRAGQYSIRVNDQWRICFRWKQGNAHDVEITDYH